MLPYPAAHVVRRLRDKRALPGLFAEGGFRTVATLAEGTAAELLGASLPHPCVLKPTGRGKGMGTVEEMRSERHLYGVLRALPPDEPLLVQEKLSGPLGSLGVLRPCAARLLLPIAWQSAVTNGAAGSPSSYRIGVTYRWLEGDVVAAIQGTPDILRRRCAPPKVGDMWARDDPMASVVYGSQTLAKRVWQRVPRQVRRRLKR
ncbi:MAG: hypothetical protein H0V03_07225 [Thermoleophilaceae bacterium]|nr:hypothetical protein [Thermoleophilaceae bacterium]